MGKAAKIWMIVGAALIIVGACIFVLAMALNKWDFQVFSTVKCEMNEYEISDSFSDISINEKISDITILPSCDGKVRVVCFEESKAKHTVSVVDGVLKIDSTNTKEWYDYISIGVNDSPKITLYLPVGEYGKLNIDSTTGDISVEQGMKFAEVNIGVNTADINFGASVSGLLQIHTTTGDIELDNITVGELDIKTSTGDVDATNVVCANDFNLVVSTGGSALESVVCKSLISKGGSGDISMENVLASYKLDIERNTGDIEFTRCDASEVDMVTSTGCVRGSFIRDMMIFANTDTGDINVPKSTEGGRCEITTDTGDIIITIAK